MKNKFLNFRNTFKSHVKTESRYGMCLFLFDELSDNADITNPNVSNDLFILLHSFNLSPESTPLLDTFSLPARSTKLILLNFSPVI